MCSTVFWIAQLVTNLRFSPRERTKRGMWTYVKIDLLNKRDVGHFRINLSKTTKISFKLYKPVISFFIVRNPSFFNRTISTFYFGEFKWCRGTVYCISDVKSNGYFCALTYRLLHNFMCSASLFQMVITASLYPVE
jgi:hypothetical protein